jgi:transglutaminase-like putative cysteine protease
MSLGHNPARTQNAAVNDPSYTVDDFCAAERMSRSMLYKAWAEAWGPDFYWVGVTRRITHRARLKWQCQREAEAAKSREAAT